MTKAEIKKLQELLAKEDTKGKKLLERVIWLNTTSAKYNVGDFVKFTDYGHSVYGVPVKDFKGRVKQVMSNSQDRNYNYELEIIVGTKDEPQLLVTNCFVLEKDISGKVRSNNNVIKSVSKNEDTIGISLSGRRAW